MTSTACPTFNLFLLADTEFLENRPENIFDVHPAQQPPQGVGGGTKLFGRQLFAVFYELQTPTQAVRCLAEQIALFFGPR